MSIELPGGRLGLLGGGQLARMTAMAARHFGLSVSVLDPQASCAAAGVSDRVLCASFDDPVAAADLARGCAAVTWDTEQISSAAVQAAAREAVVRPGPAVLALVSDRIAQKSWLEAHGFPLPRWAPARSAAELQAARATLGRCRAKSATGGYDGRGQEKLGPHSGNEEVFARLGACVVEEEVSLELELSVLVARGVGGELRVFPLARNWHVEGILHRTLLPAGLDQGLEQRAVEMARALAEQLELVGLLTVELFVDSAGRLLVNEVAARTHNTFHGTVECCATSQFEQLVRAVCGLPLGSTELRTRSVLVNLLGDEWSGAEPPNFPAVLELPGVALHLYGKAPRAGRKVGHLVVTGAGEDDLLARADEALRRLRTGRQEPRG